MKETAENAFADLKARTEMGPAGMKTALEKATERFKRS
jgi:hypothetical protein